MDETTRVADLRCEYLKNPLGIDETDPRLSWIMVCDRRGARQLAYRLLVASSRQRLAAGEANLWDSGRVDSEQSSQIVYRGRSLRSRMACHWQVAIWDEKGAIVKSQPASWTMGLLQPGDWQARWITHNPEIIRRDPDAFQGTELQPGTAPLFRKTFGVPAQIRRATLYATASGIFDLQLNGEKVSRDQLMPEWTDYHKRLHYRTYDVTNWIVPGDNALGAILGDGWWTGYVGWQETPGQYGTLENSILLQLEVELDSGETVLVVSDRSWRCETGPILFSDFMMGETYDARRERDRWDQAGYDDSDWLPALEVEAPKGEHFIGLDGLGGSAGWADAGIIIPWTIWRVYGDRRIIQRHWDSMVGWLDWLERTNPEGIRCNHLGNNYGDWLCIPADTSFRTHSEMKTLLATAYWADDAVKMSQMANVLQKPRDAERFDALAMRVRDAFQRKWLMEDGRLAVDTQTAYLLALAFDLLPENVRKRSAARLVENIMAHNCHLSTGFIGISHLNPILTSTGHVNVAYRLLGNEDYPSWLYPVVHGATSIWERWNGWTEEGGFFDPQMNSFNHYSLGSVSEWLYRHVAGIELDWEVPGFKYFIIKPFMDGTLQHAGARYKSIHGTIESWWKLQENSICLRVCIPANTKARVYCPCPPGCMLRESGKPVAESEGVRYLDHDGSFAVLVVESGTYEFRVDTGS